MPVYETSEKDYELHTLSLMLEYLAVEDDVRPVKMKFHTYPVTSKGKTLEGLVETDDDILALYNPKAKIHSQLIETEIDLTDKESNSSVDIQKPNTEANAQSLAFYAKNSARRNMNMQRVSITPR